MTEPLPPGPPPGPAGPPSLRPPPDAGGGGGFLRGRTGNVPNWAILGGAVLVGVVALVWWNHRKSSSTTDSSTAQQPVIVDDSQGQFESILALLRDQQGQASVPVSAPPAPTPSTTPDNPNPTQIPTPTPASTPTAPTAPVPQRVYVVQSGDNLTALAGRLGTTWANLYYGNQATIENAAVSHGKGSSRGGPNNSPGWWIWPGERLVY